MKSFFDSVLIIDDNRVSNFFNKKVIEKSGITKKILAFEDSQTAYNYINPKKTINRLPCIVFLDLYMPNMNGWEFLDKFSAYEKANESVFVVMCSHDLLPEEQMALNQYSFIKSVTDKNITADFVDGLVNQLLVEQNRRALKYS